MGPVQPRSAPEEETKAAPARASRRPGVPERCFSSPPAPNLSLLLAQLASHSGSRFRPSCFQGLVLARLLRALVLVPARTEGAFPPRPRLSQILGFISARPRFSA